MPTIYFSWVSRESEPVVESLTSMCESFLEGKWVLGRVGDDFVPEKIKRTLMDCDVLCVVIEEKLFSAEEPESLIHNQLLNERLRFEIITAMNLDVTIISLLVGDVVLSEKEDVPGAWKHLLECKSCRLRNDFWSEDLHQFFEDIEEELDFKKNVVDKLSKTIFDNYEDLTDAKGENIKAPGLDLGISGALKLRQVVESETFNLEEARRIGDRIREKNALSQLGLAFAELGQTQRAIQCFQQQLILVRENENVEEECGLLASLGDAFAISGNIETAKVYYQEQLLRADPQGLRAFVGSAYNGLGYVYVKQDKVSRAIDCYLKALEIYREFEDHEKELELLVGIGLNYQKLGELKRATEYLEMALNVSKYLENRKEEGHLLVDLGGVYHKLKNFERVKFHLDRAEEILVFHEEPWAVELKKRIVKLRLSLNG